MDTKKCLVIIWVMLCSFLFIGCSPDKTSVEERQKYAIQFTEDHWFKSKKEVVAQLGKDVLPVLKSIDVKAINNPLVTSAIFISGKNNSYDLFVIWIEKYPSVDGLEFQYSAQEPPLVIPIPEQELKQNKECAKSTVVFVAEYWFVDEPELRKNFDQISSAKDLKVRLLRAKSSVTEWHPVRFYKAGHWIE